jgi:hypothetical protein
MPAFFDSFRATPNGGTPPTSVTLSAALRTDAGTESVVLRYRLEDENDVWFSNAPENSGRLKEIVFPRNVNSGGTNVTITAPLSYAPGIPNRTAVIQGAVLPSGSGQPMDQSDEEITIR